MEIGYQEVVRGLVCGEIELERCYEGDDCFVRQG